jgi:molybdopterin converting factor small subunit
MQVTVHYVAQLRRAAGCPSERFDLASALTVGTFLRFLAGRRVEGFRNLIMADTDRVQPSLLVFVGDQPADAGTLLRDGDVLTLMTPMAGG